LPRWSITLRLFERIRLLAPEGRHALDRSVGRFCAGAVDYPFGLRFDTPIDMRGGIAPDGTSGCTIERLRRRLDCRILRCVRLAVPASGAVIRSD
jgi:hypothetical protein